MTCLTYPKFAPAEWWDFAIACSIHLSNFLDMPFTRTYHNYGITLHYGYWKILHIFNIINTWNHLRICKFGVIGYIHTPACMISSDFATSYPGSYLRSPTPPPHSVILLDNLEDIQAFSISHHAVWCHSYHYLHIKQILVSQQRSKIWKSCNWLV